MFVPWCLPFNQSLTGNALYLERSLHSKNAGLKNNPTLTQPLGNYGTEHTLGCFDPSVGFKPFGSRALLFCAFTVSSKAHSASTKSNKQAFCA